MTERKTRSGTTVDELYAVLRERIIDGTYGPNYRMSQRDIAEDLDVSRTPLREALRRLEADGFLVSEANRGMQVAPIANADTEQHYAVRLLVEPPIMAALVEQITDADLAAMREIADTMRATTNRTREFQEAHRQFHDVALVRYPPAIADMTRSLHTMIYRHQRAYFSRPTAPEEILHVDDLFLQAIADRRPDAVRQLLEFHLLDAAIGLVLDFDPDHRFDALLLALDGLGIAIDHDEKGCIERPTRMHWLRKDATRMPAMTTTNLTYEPGSRR